MPPAGQHSEDKLFSEETSNKLKKYLGHQDSVRTGLLGGNRRVQEILY